MPSDNSNGIHETSNFTTGSSVDDKFFGKSKYRPASILSSVKISAPLATVSDTDQHIEPSIRQSSKLFNNNHDEETKGNRFQQIGEPNVEGVSVEQELLLDAITTISRAPLPLTSTTTTRKNVEPATVERTTEHHGVIHVEQNFPRKPNQRATTHKYNITHQYPYPLGYTEPLTISTSTRRSPVSRKTKQPATVVYNGPYESGRKHHDDITSRTRTTPIDYDYYDDDNTRVIGKSTSQVRK
ncbi:hypothetical protein AND_003485 [Anopheles darlingi]|uniref:Uncharacterized protein n=1 Tax=Anopheles darlingi TaxID=43151 RepID=W5JN71_ANODA|nr:hypothetical protein AND_003485 [Anopheles darlingi]